MRAKTINRLLIIFLVTLPVAFSSCVKDECTKLYNYTLYRPVYKTKAEVRENIKSSASREIENPGKICMLGRYIFLNDVDKGIHVIDNLNPAAPVKVGFINIPGNIDIAIKGNALYADFYTDLVTLDISNPLDVKLKNLAEGIFPQRAWGNGFFATNTNDHVITEWVSKDTTIAMSCVEQTWIAFDGGNAFVSLNSAGSASVSPIGKGGSMARFTIIDERLYTVDNSTLNVFNISNTFLPAAVNSQHVGWRIETLYPFKDKLFIGSSDGMYVYSVGNPDQPSLTGTFQHVSSCDPVIADDNYAYVTLRSGTACQGFTNQLEIVKLNSLVDPVLLKTYPLTNPHGLSKDGNLLFICDGADGVKVFNSSNVMDLSLVKHIEGIRTFDVIAQNNIALVVASDGIYQYSYSNPSNIHLLSKITRNE